MTSQTNRNNIIPEIKRVSFVMMVMLGCFATPDTFKFRSFGYSSKPDPLVYQCATSNFLRTVQKFFLISPNSYCRSLFRVLLSPQSSVFNSFFSKFRIVRESFFVITGIVFRYAGSTFTLSSHQTSLGDVETRKAFNFKAVRAFLFGHVVTIASTRLGRKHFQATQ